MQIEASIYKMTKEPILSSDSGKFNGIQILRGLAAIMVVFSHMCEQVYTFHAKDLFFGNPVFVKWGSSGVDVFFVISGFIMYYTSIRKKWDFAYAKSFLIKRIKRIYPLYWIFTSILLVIIIGGWGLRNNPITGSYVFFSYLLIPSVKPGYPDLTHPILTQGWPLSFEMYFYLVFSIGILLKQQKYFLIFITALLFALAGLAGLFYHLYLPVTQLMVSPLIIEFIFGIVVAKIVLSLKSSWLAMLHKMAYLLIATIFIGLLGLYLTVSLVTSDYLRVAMWGVISMGIVFSGALLKDFQNLLSKVLIFFGNASFSIYLAHGFFSVTLGTLLKKGHLLQFSPDLLIVFFTILATLACSVVYLAIEKPMTKLLR